MGRRKAKRKKAERKAFWTVAYITAAAILISATGLPFRHALLQAEDSSQEKININAFASMSRTLSYYSWKGEVVLEGTITEEKFLSEYLTFHLDDHVVPFAKAEKADMVHKDGKYAYSVALDTSIYAEGLHIIAIYDGDRIIATEDGEPAVAKPYLRFRAFFTKKPNASITNVNNSCNMRADATTKSSIVKAVALGEEVEILGSTTGEYRTEYSTDLWYKVRYTDETGAVFEGYIISALVSNNAIEDIGFSAEGMKLEGFSTTKTEYKVYLPEDTAAFSIDRIIRHSAEDSVEIILNGTRHTEKLGAIPIPAGDSVIEINCIAADASVVAGYKFNIGRISKTSHDAFLASLAKFPASYRDKLMILHSTYPDWVFTPFETGLNWDDVINAQDSGTVSLIWKDVKPEYKKDDIIKDSSNFVTASRAAVEYYIDPRNFLNEKNIFMFEQLSYNTERHTFAGVTKLLNGTGLAGREQLFLDAGIESGVSPYHLAARSRQEVTVWNPVGLSPIARGDYTFEMTREAKDGEGNVILDDEGQPVMETYTDERYKGLYNFYNIGTGSSTDLGVLFRRGLNYARGYYTGPAPIYYGDKLNPNKELYKMPWDTEAKAITGGAMFIGTSYINCGQDTLYLQKFDVDNSANGIYAHQYMQNVQAPFSESSATYRTYMQMDNLSNNFIFRIPIYLNMPDNDIPLPEETGRLSSLEVSGYTVIPSFDPFITSGYSVVVPDEAETVDIKALGLDSRSVITGSGKTSLLSGENKVDIVCTPPNGKAITYSLTITRNLPEKSSDNYLLSLSLKDIPFDREFSTTDLGSYNASVPYDVTSATITALQRSDTAKVTLPGKAGKVSLKPGVNTFPVIITSENGRKREYKISIERIIPKITSDLLKLENGTVTGLDLSSTAGVLKTSLQMNTGTIEVYDKDGKLVPDNSMIGTGSCVKLLFNKEVIEEYIVVIYGDINGDGKINSTDILFLRSTILRSRKLEGEFFVAADINKDGKINSTDLIIMRRHILRLKEIDQTV